MIYKLLCFHSEIQNISLTDDFMNFAKYVFFKIMVRNCFVELVVTIIVS